MRVADCLMNTLREHGVSQIFFISGRGILFLTDALARNDAIDAVATYHEQGAAFAAMAYAQATGRPGVCLVSTGCAATNAVTPLLCAWQDNVPLVVISGNHMLEETTAYTGLPLRTYGSQEADIISVVKPITKYAKMVMSPHEASFALEKALHLAMEGRKGPAWIDVPLDIQNSRVDAEAMEPFSPPHAASENLEEEVERILEELSKARRPILLGGGGIRSGDAVDELRDLLGRTGLPFVFTPAACDVYGSSQKLSIGAVGSIGGSRSGNFALQNADYIFAVGTKLCSQVTGTDREKFAREARIVVVDIDPAEHTKKGVPLERVILADGKDLLRTLLSRDLPVVSEEWRKKCCHWKEIFSVQKENFVKQHRDRNEIDLYCFSDRLSDFLPEDAVLITDAGFEELILPAAVRYRLGQRCLFPASQGAMGYGIPAILGAHFAGKKNIVAVVGDGSIMMNLQELQAIAFHRIPVKIFVINNGMYAVIRKRQRDLFRNRTIGNDPSDGLGAPNFSAIASAFDLPYLKWNTASEMEEHLEEVFASEGGVLCEVMCTENQIYLHKSYGLNEKRRLENRPLEDLSPFMDRELLKSEMIVPLWEGGET